jgi:hypothetical protein
VHKKLRTRLLWIIIETHFHFSQENIDAIISKTGAIMQDNDLGIFFAATKFSFWSLDHVPCLSLRVNKPLLLESSSLPCFDTT